METKLYLLYLDNDALSGVYTEFDKADEMRRLYPGAYINQISENTGYGKPKSWIVDYNLSRGWSVYLALPRDMGCESEPYVSIRHKRVLVIAETAEKALEIGKSKTSDIEPDDLK